MKKIKSEIRMWIAEKLLSWSFDVTPWDEDGQKLRNHISSYYLDKIEDKCLFCNGSGKDGHDRCDPPNWYVCENCNGSGQSS